MKCKCHEHLICWFSFKLLVTPSIFQKSIIHQLLQKLSRFQSLLNFFIRYPLSKVLKPKSNSRCKSPNDDEKPSSFQPVMIKLNRGFTVYVYLQMIFSIQPEQFQIWFPFTCIWWDKSIGRRRKNVCTLSWDSINDKSLVDR